MEARKMFEELNFEQIKKDDNYIEYVRNGFGGYISILFSLRWKTIKSTCGYQARGINYHEITLDELKAIVQQAKELGWLEDEKQEIKQETNYEHYKDGIIELCVDDLAISKGKISECNAISCSECVFVDKDGRCIGCNEIKKWLKQPYKNPPYKLSQFEYDLIQTYSYVHEGYTLSKFKRLIKLKDKGYFKCVDYDTKIQDILANCEVIQ